ncbi:MAG: acylphosphatase [Aquificaceae bacterium]|nr:acylphosphatase [Aquificaceae bacterium]MCX8076151.1 acylphosphatase [Aquificaceae bacterium]MDW8433248.1 acylphosphatase [Aquificaceae bacterium]
MIALRIYVSGIVQGVGYRAFSRRVANSYGLSGYVRNLPDGRVELFVQGDRDVVWSFLKELMDGPPGGRVDSMEVIKEVPRNEERDFTIKY